MVNKANKDTFAMLKKQTEKAVLELLSQVQACTAFDTESLKSTLKQVNATQTTLISWRKNNNPTPTILLTRNEPSNKNIENKDFFLLKRREKQVRLVKPTSDEKDELFRKGYEWLDKLETKFSNVMMVNGVSCDSIKNNFIWKKKFILLQQCSKEFKKSKDRLR